jgi:hypothetical protein
VQAALFTHVVDNSGNVGIGTTTPNYPLHINDSYNVSSGASDPLAPTAWLNVRVPSSSLQHATGGQNSPHVGGKISLYAVQGIMAGSGLFMRSDDRIKSFEIPIPIGLNEILELKPKFYLKHPTCIVPEDDETGSTLPIDENGNLFEMIDGVKVPLNCEFEYGLISQEVEKIERLKILVTKEEMTELKIKHVNYVGLIPVLVKAVQELDEQLQVEKTKVATLEAENTDLRADIELIKEHLGISTEVG